MSKKSLLIVYTGDGKGKTTAALGLIFRALGRQKKIAMIQFIKGDWETGERLMADKIDELTWHTMGRGFTWESEDLQKDKNAAAEAWQKAKNLITEGQHDIIVLDELTYTFHHKFLDLTEVLSALQNRPQHVHIVITGRDAPQKLIDAADLVTEMNAIKHPFDQGIPAQKAIDF